MRRITGIETERLNFLTDGVYAIAMTLLVLEIKVPEGLKLEQVLPSLLENAPKFAAYLIAFSACAIGWTFTFLVNGLVRRAGPGHLFCTLISLLTIALLPFASALMGAYPDSPWGYVAYIADIGVLSGLYATDVLLAERTIPPHVERRPIFILGGSAATLAGLCGLLGGWLPFVSPRACLYVIGLVTLVLWGEYVVLFGWMGRAMEALRNNETLPGATSRGKGGRRRRKPAE